MTFVEIEEKLLNYPRFKKVAGFETVRAILKQIDYKEDIPVIHVAGTNGKGSVVAMLSSILRVKGLRVGIFTSPHLVDIRERMTINQMLMSKESFVDIYTRLKEIVNNYEASGGEKPTFFEWLFLMSLMYFNECKPDVIILETGLGGRLDTTNVLDHKILSIITSIGLDHTSILGSDIEGIAREKAGIMRRGIPTVLYNNKQEVTLVVDEVGQRLQAPVIKVLPFNDKIFKRDQENIDFSLGNKYYNYEALCSKTVQDYRLSNAQIAITSARQLEDTFEIDSEDIIKGLADYSWPGRLEYISDHIVVDGAHNADGMSALAHYMNTCENHRPIEVLFACMPDKDSKEMIQHIISIEKLSTVYIPLTSFIDLEGAQNLKNQFDIKGYKRVIIVENLEQFIIDRLSDVGARTLLGCIGSLYLVGEVLKIKRRLT